MVVVSLFTKKIPRDELGGLTWPTIKERPISHGAIGEEEDEPGKAENGTLAHTEGLELLEKNGKVTSDCSFILGAPFANCSLRMGLFTQTCFRLVIHSKIA